MWQCILVAALRIWVCSWWQTGKLNRRDLSQLYTIPNFKTVLELDGVQIFHPVWTCSSSSPNGHFLEHLSALIFILYTCTCKAWQILGCWQQVQSCCSQNPKLISSLEVTRTACGAVYHCRGTEQTSWKSLCVDFKPAIFTWLCLLTRSKARAIKAPQQSFSRLKNALTSR